MIINPKFNIGDKVWAMVDNMPEELIIYGIDVRIRNSKDNYTIYIFYCISETSNRYPEHSVFATKEDLKNSLFK